jgi:hypothetical protein
MSKFALDVLQKRVFPFMETDDPDVILGAVFGEDVALTRAGGDVLVSHSWRLGFKVPSIQ